MTQKHPVGTSVPFFNSACTILIKIARDSGMAVEKVLSARNKPFVFKKVKEFEPCGLGREEFDRQFIFGRVSRHTVRANDGCYEKPEPKMSSSSDAVSEMTRSKFRILMKWAPYGELGDVVRGHGALGYSVAWRFFDQILASKMHRHSYFHGGIAPRNIFIFSPCKFTSYKNP
ncbi:hypothetical protein L596_008543 [Steinernema carpocapsae]|uniref:Protein kinase domain-containing protein n=1 Tax=Steinernema carpocapsae TaxID=34508 RepID=A0A4U5PDB6_STECR|nr:hypothetical protein L596_008543 [Steinernema carpocapsae]